jgi:hypothetical protein
MDPHIFPSCAPTGKVGGKAEAMPHEFWSAQSAKLL